MNTLNLTSSPVSPSGPSCDWMGMAKQYWWVLVLLVALVYFMRMRKADEKKQ